MPRPAWNRALQGLSPTWFTVVMGTGIVAVVGARLTLPGVRVLSISFGVLAAVLLGLLLVGSALRWRLHPRTSADEVADPGTRPLAGAPPVALLTVSSVVGALAPTWTPVQSVLWTVGTVVGVLTALAVPMSLLGERDERVNPTWLLGVAPLLVSASTGATLVARAPAGEPRLVLLGLLAALAGAGTVLGLVLTVLVVGQSHRSGGLHGDAEPPVWVVLGTLAQAAVAALLLGAQAAGPLEPGLAASVRGASLLVAVALWGSGAFVLVVVVGLTVRELRSGLGFGLSWWSFTFPLGSAVLATVVLGSDVGSSTLRIAAEALFGVQLLVWFGVAGATVRGVARGELLPRD